MKEEEEEEMAAFCRKNYMGTRNKMGRIWKRAEKNGRTYVAIIRGDSFEISSSTVVFSTLMA